MFWLIIICNANTEYFGRHIRVTRDMTSQFYRCVSCVISAHSRHDIIDREKSRARCTSLRERISRRNSQIFSFHAVPQLHIFSSLSLSRNVSAKSSRFSIQQSVRTDQRCCCSHCLMLLNFHKRRHSVYLSLGNWTRCANSTDQNNEHLIVGKLSGR